MCDRPMPTDPYSAKFSLQHTVAIAVSDGQVVQAIFDADARQRIATQRGKVKVAVSDAINAAYPGSWGSEVTIVTSDGTVLREVRHEAKGDPEYPLTADEIAAKAHLQLEAGGHSKDRCESLIETILDLPNDRPIRDLELFMGETTRGRPRVARNS